MMADNTHIPSTDSFSSRNGWPRSLFSSLGSHEQTVLGVTPCGGDAYRAAAVLFAHDTAKSIVGSCLLRVGEESSRAAAGALGIRPDTPTVFAMPRSEVLLKTIRVPVSDPHQIARMMAYEVALHLPWSSSESQSAYQIQTTDDDGYTNVLLFMAKKSQVEAHLARLREWRIRPTRVETSVLSVARLLRASQDSARPAMLVLGAEGLTFVRLSKGYHAFSRGTSVDEDPAEMLLRTLDLDARRNGPKRSCTSLIVAGERASDFEKLLGSPPNEIPVASVSDSRIAVLNGAGPLQPETAVCVAAALGGCQGEPNTSLLPERESRALSVRQLLRQGKVLLVLLIWFAVLFSAAAYFSFAAQRSRAESAEEAIRALGKEVGDLRVQNEALSLLAGERARVRLPLRVVLELYDLTPLSIALNSFRYDARGTLAFGGEAPSFPAVYEYLDALLHSELFSKVEMKYGSKPRGDPGEGLVEFKVTCTVKEGA